MRILLKILAAPVVAALTVLTAVLYFLLSIANWLCGVLCFICVACGLFAWLGAGMADSAIRIFIVAFLISPFAIPAVAEWIIDKLSDLNFSLKCFITE